MKKLFLLFVVICLMACERPYNARAFIKGIWECQSNGVQMTLDFGAGEVEYECYVKQFNAKAVYKGTYTIQENDITLEFFSLTTTNSSKIEYVTPDQMPRNAVLKDSNTLLYMDNFYVRKEQ